MATEETALCRSSESPPRGIDTPSSGYSTEYHSIGVSQRRSFGTSRWEGRLQRRSSSGYDVLRGGSSHTESGSRRDSRDDSPLDLDAIRLQLEEKEEKGEEEEEKDVMREEHKCLSFTMTCSLVPACAIQHWKCCCRCYCIWILCLILLISLTFGFTAFWFVKIFNERARVSERMDMSTSAVYNVSAIFPQGNVYSTRLCLDYKDSMRVHNLVSNLAYITLSSQPCSQVSTSIKDEIVSLNSAFQVNYIFYWLGGTTFTFQSLVNGSSLVSVYLLNNKEAYSMCTSHIKPSKIVKEWEFSFDNCALLKDVGVMKCTFNYTIEMSGTYFICINSTIFTGLSYNITISSVVYNTSASKTALECTTLQTSECCLSYEDLFTELFDPTCMFVTTTPVDSTYAGFKLPGVLLRVEQRIAIIGYCVLLIVIFSIVLLVTILVCCLARYKMNHLDFDLGGCGIRCNVFGSKE